MSGVVQHHASALRNRGPIAKQLHALFDPLLQHAQRSDPPVVLEIGSGTGAHVEMFATEFPRVVWQPSEYIQAGMEHEKLACIDLCGANVHSNVRKAVALDASLDFAQWPTSVAAAAGSFFAVYCSNVFHISPWEVTKGVIAGASAALRKDGMLITYGPYMVDGKFTTESNREFDMSLRARNASWGYRDIAELQKLGQEYGLKLQSTVAMPANNFMLVFVKALTGSKA